MALLQINFKSATLHRKVSMQVMLPSDAEFGEARESDKAAASIETSLL